MAFLIFIRCGSQAFSLACRWCLLLGLFGDCHISVRLYALLLLGSRGDRRLIILPPASPQIQSTLFIHHPIVTLRRTIRIFAENLEIIHQMIGQAMIELTESGISWLLWGTMRHAGIAIHPLPHDLRETGQLFMGWNIFGIVSIGLFHV